MLHLLVSTACADAGTQYNIIMIIYIILLLDVVLYCIVLQNEEYSDVFFSNLHWRLFGRTMDGMHACTDREGNALYSHD